MNNTEYQNAIEQFISDVLIAQYEERLKALGYWCPLCNVEAFPANSDEDTVDLSGGNGWCPMCGLNPMGFGEPTYPERLGKVPGYNAHIKARLNKVELEMFRRSIRPPMT